MWMSCARVALRGEHIATPFQVATVHEVDLGPRQQPTRDARGLRTVLDRQCLEDSTVVVVSAEELSAVSESLGILIMLTLLLAGAADVAALAGVPLPR